MGDLTKANVGGLGKTHSLLFKHNWICSKIGHYLRHDSGG
jgi:hypothetical protein